MCALYAFARLTDDIGDCAASRPTRAALLAWWRATVELNLSDPVAGSPVMFPDPDSQRLPSEDAAEFPFQMTDACRRTFPSLIDSAVRHQIPTQYFLEIIDGVIAGQQKTRFDTFEQLEHYCYLVATAVGIACLHIWGFKAPLPMAAAVDCGLAFQLTNILRDILEDSQHGRIYLPRQHYEQHGLVEDDLLNPRGDDRLRCLLADEIARTEQLFQSGWRVWDSLESDGRPIFSMMWRTYRALLSEIEREPLAVATGRVTLSTHTRLTLARDHFIRRRFLQLPLPGNALITP